MPAARPGPARSGPMPSSMPARSGRTGWRSARHGGRAPSRTSSTDDGAAGSACLVGGGRATGEAVFDPTQLVAEGAEHQGIVIESGIEAVLDGGAERLEATGH